MKFGDMLKWGAILGIGYAVYTYMKKNGGNPFNSFGEEIGGDIYTAINGDPNAQVQSGVQSIMAALKAEGNPAVGSAAYNQIMVANGRPDLVVGTAGMGDG